MCTENGNHIYFLFFLLSFREKLDEVVVDGPNEKSESGGQSPYQRWQHHQHTTKLSISRNGTASLNDHYYIPRKWQPSFLRTTYYDKYFTLVISYSGDASPNRCSGRGGGTLAYGQLCTHLFADLNGEHNILKVIVNFVFERVCCVSIDDISSQIIPSIHHSVGEEILVLI